MAWYKAYYRDDNGLVEHIDFGKYCYGTFHRKEAFETAQDVATRTGKVVTVSWDIPRSNGLEGHYASVYPIRGKIKFVRTYTFYNEAVCDVVYHSGRCVSHTGGDIPKTVRDFIETSTICKKHHDKAFHREEKLYF